MWVHTHTGPRAQEDISLEASEQECAIVLHTDPHELSSTGRYFPHTKTDPTLQIMLSALLWSLTSQAALFDFGCIPTQSQLQPHILADAPPAVDPAA
jgi:hypothetical protein